MENALVDVTLSFLPQSNSGQEDGRLTAGDGVPSTTQSHTSDKVDSYN